MADLVRQYVDDKRSTAKNNLTDRFFEQLQIRPPVTNYTDDDLGAQYAVDKNEVIGVIEDDYGWDFIVYDVQMKAVVVTNRNAGIALRTRESFDTREQAEAWLIENAGQGEMQPLSAYWMEAQDA